MDKATAMHNIDNLPDELKALDQWVVCNNVKVPINAKIGSPASSTDPNTWSSYDKAKEAVLSGRFKHVGFVFTAKDPYVGIDLDDVFDEAGEMKPWAQAIIDQMDSYTEVSQSGKGIHIIVRGKKPGERCRADNIEVYDQGRYFALTGDLLDEARNTIEDRQDKLDSLYHDTFGTEDKISSKPASYRLLDLVLHQDASPPQNKLNKILKDDRFLETWEYRRTDLTDNSLSGHDLSLASQVAMKGWDDQEIADLIVAFRRKNGNEKDLKKALRLDYISNTINNARYGAMLELLPFTVKRLIQYGTEDAELTLELEDGTLIDMGETSAFLSPRRARNRLWERGYTLSQIAIKRWPQITDALRALVDIQTTVTALEETEQWLRNHLTTRYTRILMIDPDNPEQPDSLSKALTVCTDGMQSIIRDKQGRIYLSLNAIISHARMSLGQSLTQKALAIRLRRIGFERAGVSSNYSGGKHSRVKMWMSPVGFLPPLEGKERLVPSDRIDQISEAVVEEEMSSLDRASRKIRREG